SSRLRHRSPPSCRSLPSHLRAARPWIVVARPQCVAQEVEPPAGAAGTPHRAPGGCDRRDGGGRCPGRCLSVRSNRSPTDGPPPGPRGPHCPPPPPPRPPPPPPPRPPAPRPPPPPGRRP